MSNYYEPAKPSSNASSTAPPTPYTSTTAKGRIVDVNRVACDTLGYSRAELLDLSIQNFALGITEADLLKVCTDVCAGAEVSIEEQHRRNDGTIFHFDIRVISFPGKREPQLFAAARNITARKKAESAFHTNERRLALALSATEDGMWEWDFETQELCYSPRWFEMLGYENRQFPMRFETFQMLCHPDGLQRASRQFLQIANSTDAAVTEWEFRLLRADGTWAWVLSRGIVERDADGRPLFFIGANTDLTRSRLAEREIAEWKQRYDLLTRAAGQFVYDRRIAGTIAWGGAVAAIFGYSDEEMLGGSKQ